jgi:hypothetical protein
MESKINLTIKRYGSVLVSEKVNESLTLERAYSSYSELVDKLTKNFKESLLYKLEETITNDIDDNYDNNVIISTNFCVELNNKS